MNLSPAQWIWLPSERTLPNTFLLFRREFTLDQIPEQFPCWILADSRYRLFVNGVRVQWGPAPHDPRVGEVDPVELGPHLRLGANVVALEVCHFGHGDGTWPFGKPGLIFAGPGLFSDASWKVTVDRAHRPGQYKRWFLRSLQEVFDARLRPNGWTAPGFDDGAWSSAAVLDARPDQPAWASSYREYLHDNGSTDPEATRLIPRSIPHLREQLNRARFVQRVEMRWSGNPDDWFEFRAPGAFTSGSLEQDESSLPGPFALTYDLGESMVGWPVIAVDAPAGTVMTVMVQEGHDPVNHPWLDSHHFAWSQAICPGGRFTFEPFDFECAKWIQVHFHGHAGEVRVESVGFRRRSYPWPHEPEIQCADPALQRLIDASLNTLVNSAQETLVDGMGRERQQYSGDCGHQIVPLLLAFGAKDLCARFLRTYAHGQLRDGVFSDSWPGWDRLSRLWGRQVDACGWGPIIDHSIGFVFDHFWYWQFTGDLQPIRENWDALVRFVDYLESQVKLDGLMPVEGYPVNAVWIDHTAYQKQDHKRLAFNLYAAAMLQHAMAPLAEALGRDSERFDGLGKMIQASAIDVYFEPTLGTLVCNRLDGAEPRFDDRSLATAILYDMLDDLGPSVEILKTRPASLGRSYPANAVWRLRALAKAGCIDEVVRELREEWATMISVHENNALSEFFHPRRDRPDLMSHCAVGPLYVLLMDILPHPERAAQFPLVTYKPWVPVNSDRE